MLILTGKPVCGGVAIGNIFYIHKERGPITRRRISDTKSEFTRLMDAKKSAVRQLGELYNKALPEVGEQGAAVFEVHQMMLEDEDYLESIKNIIKTESVNAEYAVSITGDNFSRMFDEMDDPYMRERAADVRDVSGRLINCLRGEASVGIDSPTPVIVAANDLSPSETIQLDKSKILAFVTGAGSTNSHTAILARTMGIPAIVGAHGLNEEMGGLFAVVDGFSGQLFIQPDETKLAELTQKKQADDRHKELLQQYKGKPNITKDGKEVLVYANIGAVSELGLVQMNDAGGVGLFRSEFLYLQRDNYPDEESLFQAYRTVAQTLAGKSAIIRTMDIGADKRIDYFDLDEEENPALGLRGIRICLTRPELFKTQLRSIYRASAFGKIGIMFPMIASLWEVREVKRIALEVRNELEELGIAFSKDVELGVMIETPAAALISDILAPEVDFFSIGTNDLTQYTLAVDRQNPRLDKFCDTHHEAVLRLIRMVAENAHKYNAWVGICGELAADLSLTKEFLQMGIDELSVSPSSVLELRKNISEITLS